MDVFTRGIRGWALSRFLDHDLALEALEMALTKGTPTIHHSDQGVQYAAGEYVELLAKYDVKISMSQKGRPDQNGYAERVIRTIKEEEVELSEYEGIWDARERIGEFIEEVYQKRGSVQHLGILHLWSTRKSGTGSGKPWLHSLRMAEKVSSFCGPLHLKP